jgi:hypothetical protein
MEFTIYTEKIFFDGFNYRTARLKETVELIYKLGEGFSKNKSGQIESNFDLSTSVTWIGLILLVMNYLLLVNTLIKKY